MGLTKNCRNYLNRLVLVTPIYGWGWMRNDPGAPPLTYEEAKGPRPFHGRITSFFEDRGEVRGCTAVIEESGHPYNEFQTVFSTREVGEFDFVGRVGYYNILIGPKVVPGKCPGVTGAPLLSGFAEIHDDSITKSIRRARTDRQRQQGRKRRSSARTP